MLVTDSSLMGSEHPSLEQRNRSVDSGQQVLPILEAVLDLPVVDIVFHLAVGIKPIGANCASGFDRRSDKAMKRCAIESGDSCHANAPDPFAILLGSDDNKRLAVDQTAGRSAGLCCAPIGFIDFHYASQTFPAGTHHRLTQFVEDQPRRLVTAQPQSPLEAKGTHAVLLTGYLPHRSKPDRQRKMSVLKHSSRQHRNLHPASSAKPKPA